MARLVSTLLLLAIAAFSLALVTNAFYIPGVAPVDYGEGSELEVFANKLESASNHISFDYHRFLYCKPLDTKTGEEVAKVKNAKHLNFGQLLTGQRAESTRYKFNMLAQEKCSLACISQMNNERRKYLLKKMVRLVRQEYFARLNLDNMPLVTRVMDKQTGTEYMWLGHPVGYMDNGQAYIFNHLSFKVLIHKPENNVFERIDPDANYHRVVGFEVTPVSMNHQINGDKVTCVENSPLKLDANDKIAFTYDVNFELSPTKWATRWDPLMKANPQTRKIQWFSIVNSMIVTLMLSALAAVVLMRTVYLDFARYNGIADEEEISEEAGWKMLHGDVFRLPILFDFLCVFVGSGVQLACIATGTTLLALVGLISPANRGSLLSIMLFIWISTSFICGFTSASLYGGLGGTMKKSVSTLSCAFLSGTFAVVFLGINFLLRFLGSTNAVPVFTILFLSALWFGVSIPLNLVGCYFGFQREPMELPVKTNAIPREIPGYQVYKELLFALIPGIAPFCVMFVQLNYILNSIWQNSLFYMFGFLSVVFLMVIITCCQIGMSITYVRFTSMNYHW
eukprot:CAMPEP_0184694392 /NCGR_PEP_ID=MMETSP0313-20130426/2376_1 /TAXON_ID=2792 /ORGANISM="Porphyridium aerugineum, Strain SAG 1380-2" /LENGTH=565 /DNA_ID=CAMNT_0027152683 /DNA_START=129 /DNA_END=1823 /DNA_ORIENTATION=-